MLTKLGVKNYKAFDEATVNIKPITILIGANNAGKSSIIQLSKMLQQTAKSDTGSALTLSGENVNLGKPINLFRNKDKTKPITLTIELVSDRLRLLYLRRMLRSLEKKVDELSKELSPLGSRKSIPKHILPKLEYLYAQINRYKGAFNGTKTFFYSKGERFLFEFRKDNLFEVKEIAQFLLAMSKTVKSGLFTVSYDIIHNDLNSLKVSRISIYHCKRKFIELNLNPDSSDGDILELGFYTLSDDPVKALNKEAVKKEVISMLRHNCSIFGEVFDYNKLSTNKISQFTFLIMEIVNIFQNYVKKEFTETSINYVGPLRDFPKRYYMFDDTKNGQPFDSFAGKVMVEALKHHTNVGDLVKTWMKRFGVEVSVAKIAEDIYALLVKRKDVELDITEVGFGISQVLPIAIQGFLSDEKSTLIMEQPEIHLHPTMQAELADLFIQIVELSGYKKRLIVETHSEYLLRRLRRRISEKKISAKHVSICLFDPEVAEKSASINNLKIEKKGFFEWPRDFYSGELLKDTVEFIKNQT